MLFRSFQILSSGCQGPGRDRTHAHDSQGTTPFRRQRYDVVCRPILCIGRTNSSSVTGSRALGPTLVFLSLTRQNPLTNPFVVLVNLCRVAFDPDSNGIPLAPQGFGWHLPDGAYFFKHDRLGHSSCCPLPFQQNLQRVLHTAGVATLKEIGRAHV